LGDGVWWDWPRGVAAGGEPTPQTETYLGVSIKGIIATMGVSLLPLRGKAWEPAVRAAVRPGLAPGTGGGRGQGEDRASARRQAVPQGGGKRGSCLRQAG